MEKKETTKVSINLPKDLHKRIKHHAIDSGTSVAAILLKWIETAAKKVIKA